MGLIRIGLSGTVILALMLPSACSFMFVNGPPEHHTEMATFECSESNAWPVIDAIWAALNGIGAASASNDNMNPQQGQIVAVGLAWLAVSGISAIYGFSKVSECNTAKRLRDERYSGRGVVTPMPAAPATPPAPVAAPPSAPTPPATTAPDAPQASPALPPALIPPGTSAPGQSAPASPVSPSTMSWIIRPLVRRSLAMRFRDDRPPSAPSRRTAAAIQTRSGRLLD